MTLFFQQVVSGLATGIIYGGLALALSVVFSGTGVLNFAQGELATLTTFIFWTFLQLGLPFWITFVCVIPVGFVIGMLIERVFVGPVEGSAQWP